jgi:ABC-type transport system involved in cytochrome bd biosynthesis fused ATPase/permease subunit
MMWTFPGLVFMTVCAFYFLYELYTEPPLVRSTLSIVPQSPDLFEGTLRENIDPVGEYSDADIWIALEQVY